MARLSLWREFAQRVFVDRFFGEPGIDGHISPAAEANQRPYSPSLDTCPSGLVLPLGCSLGLVVDWRGFLPACFRPLSGLFLCSAMAQNASHIYMEVPSAREFAKRVFRDRTFGDLIVRLRKSPPQELTEAEVPTSRFCRVSAASCIFERE